MSQDNENKHAVPKTLEALENLIEACKAVALVGTMDQFEDLELYSITKQAIDLYDRFTDRTLVEVYESKGLDFDEEVTAAKERVRKRLEIAFQASSQDTLKELALQMVEPTGKPN